MSTVTATPAALQLIEEIVADHGPVLFHQSGGCCDGTAANCFPAGEFLVGPGDLMLGEIGGSPFYIGRAHYEYWKHTQLILDVAPGHGGGFSLEGPEGLAFRIRARLFSDAEWAKLTAEDETA